MKKEGTKMNIMMRLFKEEEGQGMVEYGLIIALVSIAAIAGLVALGPKILAKFNDAAGNL
jgi:pilus assembly protein Flp/PilA